MQAALASPQQSPLRPSPFSRAALVLPDLSRYNKPENATGDFLRGSIAGVLGAVRIKPCQPWNFDAETDELDMAIEDVPVLESMSFAFLKGFAAGFRKTYRKRSGLPASDNLDRPRS